MNETSNNGLWYNLQELRAQQRRFEYREITMADIERAMREMYSQPPHTDIWGGFGIPEGVNQEMLHDAMQTEFQNQLENSHENEAASVNNLNKTKMTKTKVRSTLKPNTKVSNAKGGTVSVAPNISRETNGMYRARKSMSGTRISKTFRLLKDAKAWVASI